MVMLASAREGSGLKTRHEIDMAKGRFARLGMAFAATAACLVGSPAARAQDSEDVTVEIGHCVDLESAEERLACYGARVDAAVQERERSAATAAPENRSSTPDEETAPPQPATHDGAGDEPTVVGKITALRETVPNSYLITLDNDQVWRQIRPNGIRCASAKRSGFTPRAGAPRYASSWTA